MKSKVEIYYFSGTGNSLYVAKELHKRSPESNLIPMVSFLSHDVIETNGETVGFVFPSHGMTIPIPVKKFLDRADLKSSKYIFAIATRGGTEFRGFDKMEILLNNKGKSLDAYFLFNMPNNDPKFKIFKVPTMEEFAKVELEIQNRLNLIQKIIINQEIHKEKDIPPEPLTNHFPPVLAWMMERLIISAQNSLENKSIKDYFYSDLKCTGCGICEKICLSKKVKMTNKKPLWQEDVICFMCYACLNYCPVHAVQLNSKWYMKSYTKRNGRYPHPWATVDDIVGQK